MGKETTKGVTLPVQAGKEVPSTTGKQLDLKFSEEEFVIRAIKKLANKPYKGIHVVYSGFNEAFLLRYGKPAKPVTLRMFQDGKIFLRPVKGGVMIYLPEDKPVYDEDAARKKKEEAKARKSRSVIDDIESE